MDKEVVRNLVRWMANELDIELDYIRIGRNQRTRLGSASVRRDFLTGSVERLRISISSYNTNSGNEYWDNYNKVAVLNTIIHEFAHLVDYKRGWSSGHGSFWRNKYHELLSERWEELVRMYNLLGADDMPESWEFLIKYCDSQYFDQDLLRQKLGESVKLDYLTILKGVLEKDIAWHSQLRKIESFGMTIEFGNKELVVSKDNEPVASLVRDSEKLRIK